MTGVWATVESRRMTEIRARVESREMIESQAVLSIDRA
jgi:hypothetical protein